MDFLTMALGWFVGNLIIVAVLLVWETVRVVRSGEVARQRHAREATADRLERYAYEERKRAVERDKQKVKDSLEAVLNNRELN